MALTTLRCLNSQNPNGLDCVILKREEINNQKVKSITIDRFRYGGILKDRAGILSVMIKILTAQG